MGLVIRDLSTNMSISTLIKYYFFVEQCVDFNELTFILYFLTVLLEDSNLENISPSQHCLLARNPENRTTFLSHFGILWRRRPSEVDPNKKDWAIK